jgi:ketosteroid isomerase-like protein
VADDVAEGVLPRARLGHHLAAGLALEQAPQAGPHDGVVIRKHDADATVCHGDTVIAGNIGGGMGEHLTAAGLVAALHAAMEDGDMPPVGAAVPVARALDQLAEGLAPVAAPDMVCVMVGAPGVTTTFDGFDGLRRAWEDWGETFSELELVVDDVVEVPAGALVLTRQVGVTRHGGIRMEQDSAMLLRLREGRITAIEFHLDPELARRTGDEPPTHP